MDSSGYRETEYFPTWKHCTDYAAEIETLIRAVHVISTREENCSHVVFLIDTISSLQALKNNEFDRLSEPYILLAMSTKSCYNLSAAKEQEDNWVTYEEMKSQMRSTRQTNEY